MNISQSLKLTGVFVKYFSLFLLVPIFSVFFITTDFKIIMSKSYLIQILPFLFSSDCLGFFILRHRIITVHRDIERIISDAVRLIISNTGSSC